LFLKSTKEIIIEADKPKIPAYQPYVNNSYIGKTANINNQYIDTPMVNRPIPLSNTVKPKQKPGDIIRGFVDNFPFSDVENYMYNEIEENDEFIIALFRGTNPPDNEIQTLKEAFDSLTIFDIEPSTISESIIRNYPALFEKYFEEEMENADFFVEKTEEIIERLEDYEDEYVFLSKAILSLKYMLIKFEENESTV
jgi:hypothetical protein